MNIDDSINNFCNIISNEIPINLLDDVKDITGILCEISSDVSKSINFFKKAADIPSQLFWRKMKSFLLDISDIPIEKRKEYINKIGKRQNTKDIERMFNIINSICEKDKMKYLANLYKNLISENINRTQFFIMSNIINISVYEDLLYLRDNISEDAFLLDENTCRFVNLGIVDYINITYGGLKDKTQTKYNSTNLAKLLCKYALN